MQKKKQKLLLLDANALLHRAWHALPPLKSPDGTVVNAVYGVTSVVLKIMSQEKPDVFIACWDTEAATFRHEAYEDYKATRVEKEDELYEQIPFCQEILLTLGIPSVELDGYEADDLIATYADRGVQDGYHVRIVTGDRDTLQLVKPGIDVLTFKKGVSDTRLFDEAEVEREYGVRADQLIDWKAIKGDPSDNIPGISGIGDKGATELLQEFETLKGVLKASNDESSDIKPGLRKKLLEGAEDGLRAYDLVVLDHRVPVKQSIKDLSKSMDRDAFVDVAAKFGFRSLIARLPGEPISPHPTPPNRPIQAKKKMESQELESTSPDSALAFLKTLENEKECTISVQTAEQGTLFDEHLEGVALGGKKEVTLFTVSLLENSAVFRALSDLLQHPKIGKIAHDAKSELALLERLKLPLTPIAHDTLLAAYLLAAGDRNYTLESLVLQYESVELPAGNERSIFAATLLRDITKKQRKELKEVGADTIMERFELPLIPVLRDMERVGIQIDIPYLKKLSKELQKEKDRIENAMEKLVGHPFNPASPAQLAVILFDELTLPTKGIRRGKTGYSTAASELDKLAGTHKIIDLIHEHREIAKLLSTYVDALPAEADQNGRVHTTFNQAVAATGRLSSSNPNLQNIPIRTELGRKIRGAFVASPGMELVACDYSQIELRVAAALSKDKKMLEAFQKGVDIHTATAANIWGIPESNVTKDQRRAAKAINFGIIYGQGPVGLSQTAGITFVEAKEFIKKYFETYKGIKNYLDETKVLAHSRGYVETLFGRRRYVPDINSGIQQLQAAAERMAINMPIQGTATGDLIKLALIKISKQLPKISMESRLLLQVHDEILLEVPNKEVKTIAVFVKETMETIEKIGCPIVVDANRGLNWNQMKPVEF